MQRSSSLIFLCDAREERTDHGILVLTARGNRSHRTGWLNPPATIFPKRNPARIFIQILVHGVSQREYPPFPFFLPLWNYVRNRLTPARFSSRHFLSWSIQRRRISREHRVLAPARRKRPRKAVNSDCRRISLRNSVKKGTRCPRRD